MAVRAVASLIVKSSSIPLLIRFKFCTPSVIIYLKYSITYFGGKVKFLDYRVKLNLNFYFVERKNQARLFVQTAQPKRPKTTPVCA